MKKWNSPQMSILAVNGTLTELETPIFDTTPSFEYLPVFDEQPIFDDTPSVTTGPAITIRPTPGQSGSGLDIYAS